MCIGSHLHSMPPQEYGTGRFARKHSSFYGKNMKQLGLSVEPEHYFDICPWQTLAVINLEFIFSERRRNYLKFAGGLCYFEVRASQMAPSCYMLALRHILPLQFAMFTCSCSPAQSSLPVSVHLFTHALDISGCPRHQWLHEYLQWKCSIFGKSFLSDHDKALADGSVCCVQIAGPSIYRAYVDGEP